MLAELRHLVPFVFEDPVLVHDALPDSLPKQLQAIVGHASIQLTYDTYGDLLPDSFDGFGAGLDALLGQSGALVAAKVATGSKTPPLAAVGAKKKPD